MERIHNFSAGPAVLPKEVLEQASDELMNWRSCGMSVMEMSHRGKEFTSILEAAEADLRDLMAIPANYKVLFLQGGATLQFAQVPLNLMAGRSADYLVTGDWSKKAYKEAQRYGQVRLVASTETSGFSRFPALAEMDLDPAAAYLHVCTNETIRGVEVFDEAALPTGVPLVADMSSHILSRPMDVSRYGLIYAGAQKNIGPAGVCLVIVREDLLGQASVHTPTLLDYAIQAENGSMLNTPPTFAIYMAGLVFKWLLRQGGLAAMARVNAEKARLLYDRIDAGSFFHNPVEPANRSRMNVPFTLADPALDETFIAEAKARGIVQIKGHKSVGGMRASIYNAMPLEGVQALAEFMADFEKKHG
ncbi:MAG: 3-phosphoserine/phosphohydroxythreonine transaminase [Gallionellaceae bacterium]|nr:3-phosphoserine/phosphohydroxythreonine transaminase [Gallionellaceae bacterium]